MTPSTETRPLKPLSPPGVAPTRLWLAAIVPICAVVMLVTVILLNMSDPNSPKVGATPKLEKVSGLTASTVNPFAPLVIAGEPVSDILDSVVVPAGAKQLAIPQVGGEATSFDNSIVFSSPASEQSLYTFFHDEMQASGWRIFSTGAPVNQSGVELLAQKAGSDGWYWEQGVIVNATTFSANGSQSTRFSVRLYQASDDS
jgi:hypothetical protein